MKIKKSKKGVALWNRAKKIIPAKDKEIKLVQDIFNEKKYGPVYVLFKEHEEVPQNLPVKLILKGEKPGGAYPLLLTTLQ